MCKLNKYNDDYQKHEKNETKPFHRVTNPKAYTSEMYIGAVKHSTLLKPSQFESPLNENNLLRSFHCPQNT
jgi:hypothetical protein